MRRDSSLSIKIKIFCVLIKTLWNLVDQKLLEIEIKKIFLILNLKNNIQK